ncbi:Xanthine dehydrogenaselike, partial [Caligus rogercresseyi]
SHAEIKSITLTTKTSPGMIGFISSKDIPKIANSFSVSALRDERVFAESRVECCGQIIGIMIADTRDNAKLAAKNVCIEYDTLEPVLSIEDAIEKSSFFPLNNSGLISGTPEEALKNAEYILEGEVRTGGQEHFYLEPQCGLVVPEENGGISVHSSTQNPTETQSCISEMLNIPMSKVNVLVKRIGGGFGGKETRSIPFILASTWASVKYGRPIRFALERDEDMIMTGYRHPFLGRYKIGFNSQGIIQALDLELYANAGYTMDLSFAAMERALLHAENSYHISNIKVKGFLCKTNLPSNTAFRGFGGPQIMMIVEHYIEKIAFRLNLPPEVVRKRNLYQEGDFTYYGQKLSDCTLLRCWEECVSRFKGMRTEIEEFNAANKWVKRGLAIVPTNTESPL